MILLLGQAHTAEQYARGHRLRRGHYKIVATTDDVRGFQPPTEYVLLGQLTDEQWKALVLIKHYKLEQRNATENR